MIFKTNKLVDFQIRLNKSEISIDFFKNSIILSKWVIMLFETAGGICLSL